MTTYKNSLLNHKPLLIITAIGIIVLLFLILSSCNSNNRYVICSQGSCDTINQEPQYILYTECKTYKKNETQVIVCGNYTVTKITR